MRHVDTMVTDLGLLDAKVVKATGETNKKWRTVSLKRRTKWT